MILSRHLIPQISPWTRAKKLSVQLAFLVVFCVAGAGASQATIDNTATANATYVAAPVQSLPSTASVPVDPGTAALVVTKTADDTTSVVAGQLITYTYTVRNAGSQTLTNVSLSDVHDGSGPPPVPSGETLSSDVGTPNDSTDATANDGVWSVLAPGDSITFTATYTVTQTDVDTKQ